MGMFFNAFFRHADVVKMANLAQMVNVIAPIMTNEEGYFLQPTYFPLVEFGKQRGNTSLDVWGATHTFGADDVVRPAVRSVQAEARDGGFNYTFPAHSLTILRVELAGGWVFGKGTCLFG